MYDDLSHTVYLSLVAVIVDLRLAADHMGEQLTHRIGYELPGPVDSVTGHHSRAPSLAVDPRPPVMSPRR